MPASESPSFSPRWTSALKSESPTDAGSDRAARIAALGYDYAAQPKRDVTVCNLCAGEVFAVIAHRDRYGYPAQARACVSCGLVFLAPVMIEDAYAHFYESVYRPLVSAFHGRLINHTTIQDEQRVYAADRAAFMAPFIEAARCRTMLDIGGSTGVVAQAWAERFGLEATVIDPAPAELEEAKRRGLRTVAGFVERYDPEEGAFDLVAMCQTVDHLLDIGSSLRAVRRLLSHGGVFFIDIVDLRAAYLRNWSVEGAIKIDHPYYLTDDVMRAYLAQAGFAVRRVDFAADHLHIGYVCAPASPIDAACPSASSVSLLLREIRYVQNTAGAR
jgi:SAM-dependent methyltransferase